MMLADAAKLVLLLFAAVLVQIAVFAPMDITGGHPDIVVVTLLVAALLRGSILGAIAGFWAGFLIDVASLGTLGFTSLLLTLAGYWIGRYGETTGADRAHAPFLSVAVVTVLYAVGEVVLRFVIGEPAPAGVAVEILPATLILNLILTAPVYWFCRKLFDRPDRERTREAALYG
jgi:rod shape-determining protein MreD